MKSGFKNGITGYVPNNMTPFPWVESSLTHCVCVFGFKIEAETNMKPDHWESITSLQLEILALCTEKYDDNENMGFTRRGNDSINRIYS